MRCRSSVGWFAGLLLAASITVPVHAQEAMGSDTMAGKKRMDHGMMADSSKKMMMGDSSKQMMMDQSKKSMMADSSKMMMGMESMAPRGMFHAAAGNTVHGGYQIVEQNGKRYLVLSDDFHIENDPEPSLVLSPNDRGTGDHTLSLGKLDRLKGSSRFEIPAGTDLSGYHQVLVWSRKLKKSLAQADLVAGAGMMHRQP